jgi:hypothetical protein
MHPHPRQHRRVGYLRLGSVTFGRHKVIKVLREDKYEL